MSRAARRSRIVVSLAGAARRDADRLAQLMMALEGPEPDHGLGAQADRWQLVLAAFDGHELVCGLVGCPGGQARGAVEWFAVQAGRQPERVVHAQDATAVILDAQAILPLAPDVLERELVAGDRDLAAARAQEPVFDQQHGEGQCAAEQQRTR
jgi:hypothetical protein